MELSIEEIDGITDPIENAFAKLAVSQDLIVCDSEMITLKREKRGKNDKRSTSPDFLLKRDPNDLGIYIEVTKKNLCSRKSRQLNVMQEAGLSNRYVQITHNDILTVEQNDLDLFEYLVQKIEERECIEQ